MLIKLRIGLETFKGVFARIRVVCNIAMTSDQLRWAKIIFALPRWKRFLHVTGDHCDQPQPGSSFPATTREAKEREPGNKVAIIHRSGGKYPSLSPTLR